MARAAADDQAILTFGGDGCLYYVASAWRDPVCHPMPDEYRDTEGFVWRFDPDTGERIEPETPNAVKLESFVFDALPQAGSSIVYETSRTEEFAPIKNARGPDSPATSHQLQSDRSGAWIESYGVTVPRTEDGHVDAAIELSPLTALEREDLARVRLPAAIGRGESVVI